MTLKSLMLHSTAAAGLLAALVLGLATRFFSVSLLILTVVAIASVHWPDAWNTWSELLMGYGFTDNGFGNFKLPVLFIGMLVPLILLGPGRLSLDHWLRNRLLAPREASTPLTSPISN